MEYVPASVFKRKAWVSSKGYGLEGARNGAQHFFLHTTSDRFDYDPANPVRFRWASMPPRYSLTAGPM